MLTAIGGVATAVGLAYRWYATRKADALADALDLHRTTGPVPSAANDDVPATAAAEQKDAA